jgi:hypothetical protein
MFFQRLYAAPPQNQKCMLWNHSVGLRRNHGPGFSGIMK